MDEKRKYSERLALAVGGDRDVLLDLLIECQQELGAFVESQIGAALNRHIDEEDVLQETFIAAFDSIAQLRATERNEFTGWLTTIAGNKIVNAVRRENAAKRGGGKRQISFENSAMGLVIALEGDVETPSWFASQNEAIKAVRVAIAALPDDQRTAIELRCFDWMTLEQTAQAMERSVDSVRGLIQRGKEKIKAILIRRSKWISTK